MASNPSKEAGQDNSSRDLGAVGSTPPASPEAVHLYNQENIPPAGSMRSGVPQPEVRILPWTSAMVPPDTPEPNR